MYNNNILRYIARFRNIQMNHIIHEDAEGSTAVKNYAQNIPQQSLNEKLSLTLFLPLCISLHVNSSRKNLNSTPT